MTQPCGVLLFALFNICVGVNDENTHPISDKFLFNTILYVQVIYIRTMSFS